MGEAVDESFSQMTPDDIHALVAYPAQRAADRFARFAGDAGAAGAGLAQGGGAVADDARGKKIFAGACASCHGWTGVSPVTPYRHDCRRARGQRSDGDECGADRDLRHPRQPNPTGRSRCRPSAAAYSDTEIAAVANYVTARFGSAKSSVTENDIAGLRQQTAR